jgi:predicted enzyme related to lactoylglutathione lyase
MTDIARTGVLIYAKDLAPLSAFYEAVLGARVVHADEDHRVLMSPDAQLIMQSIPAHIASEIVIAAPPAPREEQAIKPFFTVNDLAAAEHTAEAHGGHILGPIWPGPGFRSRNVCDPEGNIIHLRERLSPSPG